MCHTCKNRGIPPNNRCSSRCHNRYLHFSSHWCAIHELGGEGRSCACKQFEPSFVPDPSWYTIMSFLLLDIPCAQNKWNGASPLSSKNWWSWKPEILPLQSPVVVSFDLMKFINQSRKRKEREIRHQAWTGAHAVECNLVFSSILRCGNGETCSIILSSIAFKDYLLFKNTMVESKHYLVNN